MNQIPHNKGELISRESAVCVASGDVLDLPAFNRWGFLPPGVYDACFEEVIERFATNSIRKTLVRRLERFLLLAIDSKSFSYAYIDGEFITTKEAPREIELILQTCALFVPDAFQAIEPFLAMGLDTIQKKYSIRLHFSYNGLLDEIDEEIDGFRDYFQFVSPQEAPSLAISTGVKKGIVRVAL